MNKRSTRTQMEDAINHGHTVIWNDVEIKKIDDLPSDKEIESTLASRPAEFEHVAHPANEIIHNEEVKK